MFRKVRGGCGSGSVAAVMSATAASLVSREDSKASGADGGGPRLASIATGNFRCRMDTLWDQLVYGGVAAGTVLLAEETSNIYLPLLTKYFSGRVTCQWSYFIGHLCWTKPCWHFSGTPVPGLHNNCRKRNRWLGTYSHKTPELISSAISLALPVITKDIVGPLSASRFGLATMNQQGK